MRILAKTKGMSHEKWLELRRAGIGGSDAAAIVGMSPWRSAFAVYQDKVGLGIPIETTERMQIGKDLEDYVCQLYTRHTGIKLRKRNAILQHDEHDFIIGNIDREVVGAKEGFEAKVTSNYASNLWIDGKVPLMYEVQCHHYMLVTGWEAWTIGALIGNERFVYRRIERDPDIIDWLLAEETKFWKEHVEAGVEPVPDGGQDIDEHLKEFNTEIEKGKTIKLIGFSGKAKRLQEIKEFRKHINLEVKSLEQEIILAMHDAEYADCGTVMIKRKIVDYQRFGNKSFRQENPDKVKDYMHQIKFNKLTFIE